MFALHPMHLTVPVLLAVWLCSCVPQRDLDATARGNRQVGHAGASSSSYAGLQQSGASQTEATALGGTTGAGNAWSSLNGGTLASGGTLHTSIGSSVSTGGTPYSNGGTLASSGGAASSANSSMEQGGAAAPSGGATVSSASDGGASSGASGAGTVRGGASNSTLASTSKGGTTTGGVSATQGGTLGTAGTMRTRTGGSAGVAPNLPELVNPPVQGMLSYSSTASWDIDGVQREAFRIETPTATYILVKSVAAIASLADQNNVLWLNFSSGYRPNRGIPNLGGCCQLDPPDGTNLPAMTTVLDASSATSTHLRLTSKPVDGDYYWLVWDFFVTHVTLTVNRSAMPFGFTFYGIPGNVLDANDELVLSTGERYRADSPHSVDLPGPAEWAYITNPETGKNASLFLIQHRDDSLVDSFSNPDFDSVRFVFGSGQIIDTPMRFSLGLVNSVDPSVVTQRISYVVNSISP